MRKTILSAALTGLVLLGGTTAAMADGDPVKGKKVWNKCRACHSLEAGKTQMGPSLAGIIGKNAGAAESFKYSAAMAASGLTWDEATLAEFLKSPRKLVKGTKMMFPGLRKPEEIENLVAFLKAN